ncbi:hypothetical protein CCP3SC1AL1_2350003 [Gammaproteobacteria bacterium]
MINNEQNVAFWNRVAQQSEFGGAYAGMLMGQDRVFEAIYRCEAEQKRLLSIFSPTQKSSVVLEIGSGGGRWGLFFSEKVKSYIGLDISPNMVAVANREAAKNKLLNVRFENFDFLEFQSNCHFDLIFFSGVLQYMNDDVVEICIAKATNLLLPGGSIITRDSVQLSSRVEKTGEYPVIYRTESEYVKFFEAAGFTQVYSDFSYAHKRFTKLSSRLYELPGVTYKMAYAFREVLCSIDKVLGYPNFLRTSQCRAGLMEKNPQEHRLFKYVRKNDATR